MTVQSFTTKYANDLAQLKTVLPDKLKHLPDEILVRGLVAREQDTKQTVELLENYVNGHKDYPLHFPLTPSSHFKPELFDIGVVGYASNIRTPKGYHVMYIDWNLWDPDKYSFSEFNYTCNTMTQALAKDLEINEAGIVMVSDIGGIGIKHVRASIASANVLTGAMTASSSHGLINVKHYIANNSGMMFNMIWGIARKLAPTRLANSTHILKKGDKKLSELLSPEIVANQSFIPTVSDRIKSRKMAEEYEAWALSLHNKLMNK